MTCKKFIQESQDLKNQLWEISIVVEYRSMVGCGKIYQGQKYEFNFLRRTGRTNFN